MAELTIPEPTGTEMRHRLALPEALVPQVSQLAVDFAAGTINFFLLETPQFDALQQVLAWNAERAEFDRMVNSNDYEQREREAESNEDSLALEREARAVFSDMGLTLETPLASIGLVLHGLEITEASICTIEFENDRELADYEDLETDELVDVVVDRKLVSREVASSMSDEDLIDLLDADDEREARQAGLGATQQNNEVADEVSNVIAGAFGSLLVEVEQGAAYHIKGTFQRVSQSAPITARDTTEDEA